MRDEQGILMDWNNIKKNECRRTNAKLALNCLWG